MICYCRREIADGDRRLHLKASIEWGMRDLRGDWQGDYDFCSFGCVAAWASDRAKVHDDHVVTDGLEVAL